MAHILKTKSIYYNDVNLIAAPGVLNSRTEVPPELHRIIVSPMEAVVGPEFAFKATDLGLTVCLHRFCSVEEQIHIYRNCRNAETNTFVSVGADDGDRIKALAKAGVKNYLIDIANGYIPSLPTIMARLVEIANPENIMIGNVMTDTGYIQALHNSVNTFVRVGIAGGSACSTSDATGYNRGQITEIMEIANQKKQFETLHMWKNKMGQIVADGGIKNGNYAAKAFGAGADYVMMGGYFARAKEAYTNVTGDGTYWGGASHKQQERWGGVRRHSEGKVYEITQEIKPLRELVTDLWGGLTSAISYSGCKTLTEFIGNGVFEIKENSLPPSGR